MLTRISFEGSRAIVTGASSGIGRATAIKLAQAGGQVAAFARRADALAELASTGRGIVPIVCDVTDAQAVERGVIEVVERFGGLDILINNAGVGVVPGRIGRVNLDTWVQTINTNLLGAYFCSHFAARALSESEHGRIVNIGSGRRSGPMAGGSAYAVSKAALWMMTQAMAMEYWDRGITINEVVPGPTLTGMTRAGEHGAVETFASERIKEPDEVADFILEVLSFPKGGPTGQSFSLLRRPL